MDFASIKSQVQNTFSSIDQSTKHFKSLDGFEQSTNLPRSYAVVALGIVYLGLVFVNVGGIGELLSNLAGFVYPCYNSLKALKTRGTSDDTRLLTYWVVFAFLNIAEFWSSAILYWIPAYFLFKTLFLIYLAAPGTNGAEVVYNLVIKPLTDKIVETPEEPADNLINKVQDKME
ncbi:DEKNAAE100966 [Brettanomyces naardenensis]|uniref:Protein YOP1 n=1 Tax=Brettanomyces naardenensis TaxID=13370 RepID=A0A448YGX9_BRENA|nr:DEKNAAE100966 [Brettanomyces naardenensis]